MRRICPIELESQQVNGTAVVTVSIGDYEVGRYRPGTRYADFAISEVEKVIAVALGDLIRPVLSDRGIEEEDSL